MTRDISICRLNNHSFITVFLKYLAKNLFVTNFHVTESRAQVLLAEKTLSLFLKGIIELSTSCHKSGTQFESDTHILNSFPNFQLNYQRTHKHLNMCACNAGNSIGSNAYRIVIPPYLNVPLFLLLFSVGQQTTPIEEYQKKMLRMNIRH